jgi:hypothetical protein
LLRWLKERKGRTLSDDDIAHYQKIVVALAETIRLMREIDEVVEQHGGHGAELLDALGRPARQVGEGSVLGLAGLAVTLAQQDGGW